MKTIITPMPRIGSYAELKQRIAYLDSIKEAQEETLKENIREVYNSLQPAELIKKAISNIREDGELMHDATHLGGKLGLNFLVGKLFKQNSIGGFVKTVATQQLLGFLYQKFEPQIHGFIGSIKDKAVDLFKSFGSDKQETPPEEPEKEK